MTDVDTMTLRAAYDAHLRAWVPDPVPDGATVERDGPLVRIRGLDPGGFVTYRDLGGLTGAALDELIARQRDYFTALGQSVEWKLHGHDEPADLADRLRAAGFRPGEQETVVVGPVAALAGVLPVPPDGVRLREVSARADLERIAAMEEQVWGDDRAWLVDGLAKELAADPQALTVVVAEAPTPGMPTDAPPRPDHAEWSVVSAGWVRYVSGTGFATLWGGSTLPQWRRRGIYRALVTYRARLAHARGFTMLQVDASEDSRPILQRLGFVPVATTTPYTFTP